MHAHRLSALLAAGTLAAFCAGALAQDEKKEIERYQKMIAEGSPVELFEMEGEALWKKRQGPKNASLEQCDLPARVWGDGSYAVALPVGTHQVRAC